MAEGLSDTATNAFRFIDDKGSSFGVPTVDGKPAFMAHVYDPSLMDYIVMTQPVIKTDSLSVSGIVKDILTESMRTAVNDVIQELKDETTRVA